MLPLKRGGADAPGNMQWQTGCGRVEEDSPFRKSLPERAELHLMNEKAAGASTKFQLQKPENLSRQSKSRTQQMTDTRGGGVLWRIAKSVVTNTTRLS